MIVTSKSRTEKLIQFLKSGGFPIHLDAYFRSYNLAIQHSEMGLPFLKEGGIILLVNS